MPRPAAALTYTIPEAAEALRISSRSVRRRIAEGTLPTVRIGGRLLIPRKALEDWVIANTKRPRGPSD
jgi:excisionase family DNA binding protein